MIFVTVGTQLAFPRLVSAVDRIAPALGHVVAQTGPDPAAYGNLERHEFLDPVEYAERFGAARVVVAHAGIGTILSAMQSAKPLVLMPRRAALGEHRNDHQMATARRLAGMPGIFVAWTAEELGPLIAETAAEPARWIPNPTHAALIRRISDFIDRG